MYEEQSDMHEEERDSSHKIIVHIEKRFSELEAILENNPDTKIIIAGRSDKLGQPSNLDIEDLNQRYGANGHMLGTVLAKGQWGKDDWGREGHSWRQVIGVLNLRVSRLIELYRDRVSIGNIGYETTGSNKVNALPSRDCIHVWGTTARNWNFAPNTIFEERSYSPAVAISKEPQKIGCFGIVVSPFHSLNGLEDDDKTHSEMIRNRMNATESEATIQTKKLRKTVSFASSNMFFEDNDKSIRSNPITISRHSYRKVPTEEEKASQDIEQTN